ncbi:hypothetical protein CKO15_04450 [Halorhodospira abdelmalekii]|nr:hypothetical protein [Halorhodospira abdelmalekii]
MPPPSSNDRLDDDPFAGAETGEVGGSEFGGDGGAGDTVELSSVAAGGEVGDDAFAGQSGDEGAATYGADGDLDGAFDTGGSEIDAMI